MLLKYSRSLFLQIHIVSTVIQAHNDLRLLHLTLNDVVILLEHLTRGLLSPRLYLWSLLLFVLNTEFLNQTTHLIILAHIQYGFSVFGLCQVVDFPLH